MKITNKIFTWKRLNIHSLEQTANMNTVWNSTIMLNAFHLCNNFLQKLKWNNSSNGNESAEQVSYAIGK
jgi:hypothetical protein